MSCHHLLHRVFAAGEARAARAVHNLGRGRRRSVPCGTRRTRQLGHQRENMMRCTNRDDNATEGKRRKKRDGGSIVLPPSKTEKSKQRENVSGPTSADMPPLYPRSVPSTPAIHRLSTRFRVLHAASWKKLP